MNHEEALIKAFILRAGQERYLEFLRRQRRERNSSLNWRIFKRLDSRFAFSVVANQSKPPELLKLLVVKGAGLTCWVVSANSNLDAKEMDLMTALKETAGCGMGTFLSCVPGKLAYFEDEDGRYILAG